MMEKVSSLSFKRYRERSLTINIIDLCITILALIEIINTIDIISSNTIIYYVTSVLRIVTYIILIYIVIRKKIKSTTLFIFLITLIVLIYGYFQSGKTAFLTAWILIFATKNYSYEKILRNLKKCYSIGLFLGVIFGIPTLKVIGQQISDGFYLGFGNPNMLGFYLVIIFLINYYLQNPRHKLLDAIIYTIFVYAFTRSRTASLVLIIFIFFTWLYGALQNHISKFFIVICESVPLILMLLTYFTAKYFAVNKYFQSLNKILTNRIFLNWFALTKNGITLFGQNIQLHYSGIHNSIIGQWNITTTIDSSYMMILLLFGIVPSIIFLFADVYVIHRGFKNKDYVLVSTVISLAIYAFMEARLTSIIFYFTFFYILANVNCNISNKNITDDSLNAFKY